MKTENLSAREVDAMVAEKIFGAKLTKYFNGGGEWKYPDGYRIHRDGLWPYTTDASSDYLVLEHAMKWPFSKRQAFANELDKLLRPPLADGCVEVYPNAAMKYQPGFYSRAALAVVEAAQSVTK